MYLNISLSTEDVFDPWGIPKNVIKLKQENIPVEGIPWDLGCPNLPTYDDTPLLPPWPPGFEQFREGKDNNIVFS